LVISIGYMEQWLRDNPGFVVGVASSMVAAIILGFLLFFGKRIVAIVIRLWTQMKRALKIGHAAQFPDLHFVALPRECILGVIPRDDPGPNVQICMHWNVTNASSSGMPARLVRARLARPRLSDSEGMYIHTGSTNGRVYPNEDIPPGSTRRLTTVFVAVLPSIRVKKPVKVKVIVVDQLSREHKLDPITLTPSVITGTGK